MPDETAVLKQVPLFSFMDEQEIAGVRTLMQVRSALPGAIISEQGEIGTSFAVIVEGQVKITVTDASGGELIVDEIGPGGYFGELSMLTGEPRSVRVTALDAVTTLCLDRTAFLDFLQSHPPAAIDVLTTLGQRLHHTNTLLRQTVSRNVNEVIDDQLTLGQRIADGFAGIMGSWPFIIVQSILLLSWVTLNVLAWIQHWDPYPFILLNLALSFQAAYAAPIIMMSQNRQSMKDRLTADIDHEVNTKAELEIGMVLQRLDQLERRLFMRQGEVRR